MIATIFAIGLAFATILFQLALALTVLGVACGIAIDTVHHRRRNRVIRDRLERIRR